LKSGGRLRGITPRLSGDETRQAVEQHGEDRLIWGAGRQVDLDLGFQFDDAGGVVSAFAPVDRRRFGHPASRSGRL
jgi:hypothetical protein